MLYILVKNICNKKLAEKQAEIEDLLENYHEIVLKSNEKVRHYFEEKKKEQQELIGYLENVNERYFKIVDEIVSIVKTFSEKYLQIFDLGIAYFNAKMQEQLTQLQIGVIEAAKEVTEEEIVTINKLLCLYKSQSDIEQRMNYLHSINLEFNTQNITGTDQFESYLKEKKLMQTGTKDLILSFEKESFNRVSIRLDNEQQIRESIKLLKQKGELYKTQESRLFRERGKKIKEIQEQRYSVKGLRLNYKSLGEEYTEAFYGIDSKYIFREFHSEEDRLSRIISEIKREQRLLKSEKTEIKRRQRYISIDFKDNRKETGLVKFEINELYNRKSYCHKSNDYSDFESINRELLIKKEELSFLKDTESRLERSKEYYNEEFQRINELQDELNEKYTEIQRNLDELEQQRNWLNDLLFNSIKPFSPGSISYRFNTLNKEITDIGSYYLPGLPAIKRNKRKPLLW